MKGYNRANETRIFRTYEFQHFDLDRETSPQPKAFAQCQQQEERYGTPPLTPSLYLARFLHRETRRNAYAGPSVHDRVNTVLQEPCTPSSLSGELESGEFSRFVEQELPPQPSRFKPPPQPTPAPKPKRSFSKPISPHPVKKIKAPLSSFRVELHATGMLDPPPSPPKKVPPVTSLYPGDRELTSRLLTLGGRSRNKLREAVSLASLRTATAPRRKVEARRAAADSAPRTASGSEVKQKMSALLQSLDPSKLSREGSSSRLRRVTTAVSGLEEGRTFGLARYDSRLLSDRGSQMGILQGQVEELKAKLVEVEQLLGPAVKRTVEVFSSMPGAWQVKVNSQLEQAVTLVVQSGRTMLLKYRDRARQLGIEDVPLKLRAWAPVSDECQGFAENLKMLKAAHLFLRKCADAFSFLLFSDSVQRLPAQTVQRVHQHSYHARLLVNQFLEQFRTAELQRRPPPKPATESPQPRESLIPLPQPSPKINRKLSTVIPQKKSLEVPPEIEGDPLWREKMEAITRVAERNRGRRCVTEEQRSSVAPPEESPATHRELRALLVENSAMPDKQQRQKSVALSRLDPRKAKRRVLPFVGSGQREQRNLMRRGLQIGAKLCSHRVLRELHWFRQEQQKEREQQERPSSHSSQNTSSDQASPFRQRIRLAHAGGFLSGRCLDL